jgi:hypothetical protein
LLLFVVAEEVDRRSRGTSDARADKVGFSRFLFPLAVYYATTLGVPLVNGAFRQSEFWEHSAFVLLIPLLLIAPVILFRLALRKPLRYARLWRASTRDACVPTSLRPRRGLAHPSVLSQDFD